MPHTSAADNTAAQDNFRAYPGPAAAKDELRDSKARHATWHPADSAKQPMHQDHEAQQITQEKVETPRLATRKWNRAHVLTVLKRIFPPPVIAAILGMCVALCNPIRGLLVDIDDRDGDAKLESLYNGLYNLGQAAVPINMLILGNSLAKGAKRSSITARMVRTAVSVAIAKMVVMPSFGLGVVLLMQRANVVGGPSGASFYLVAMIVAATPTANNIMVMAELAGENKESLAFCILVQYLFAPIVLTFWLFMFVSVATASPSGSVTSATSVTATMSAFMV